jgi:pyridinium-3,5-biscarboxylic acid mononucleotide sulfurtransferase
MPTKQADRKAEQLRENLKTYGRLAVAFSGGVDSAYLLYEAVQVLGAANVLPVTVTSVLHPACEVQETELIAEELGSKLIVLPLELFKIKAVAENSANRCYHCKKAIFTALLGVAERRSFKTVADGTNADDSGSHRPGLHALKELGVRSPLVEALLGKSEIRELSKKAGLSTWNKPSAPCLATRFPCGHLLSPEKIKAVAKVETALRELGTPGNLRVRVHGDLVRIENDPEYMEALIGKREKILAVCKQAGFKNITLDLDGYRSGSMDRL